MNLLYKREYPINDKIKVVIPTVGEIIDNEDDYYDIVTVLTGMPIDFMVQLDDIGIDFSQINEYDLFLLFFGALKNKDTHLIFGDLDLSKFELATNQQNGMTVLVDWEDDIVIDKAIHDKIASALRTIHHYKKDTRKPANKEAKEYMIERARKKLKRLKRKNASNISPLERKIIAMVNTTEYKYNFEGTRELSIYQFNESVNQVIRKNEHDNAMYGVYMGTLKISDIPKEVADWISNN